MFPVRRPRALPLAALLGVLAFSAVRADAPDGELLFETCRGCHGIAGYKNNYPTYKVPKLGGQSQQYIVDALTAYKNGTREHPTMHAQAYSLSDEEMRAIAAYLAGVASIESEVAGEPPAAAATCASCHGPNGKAIAPNFPSLAGQHADYLEHALKSYRAKVRANAIMGGFAANLDDATIEALASFYSSQDGLRTVRHP